VGQRPKSGEVEKRAVQAMDDLYKKVEEVLGSSGKRKGTSSSGSGEMQRMKDLDGNVVDCCGNKEWKEQMRRIMHLRRLMPKAVFDHFFPDWKFDFNNFQILWTAASVRTDEKTYLGQFQNASRVREFAVVLDPGLLEKLMLGEWKATDYSLGMLSLKVFIRAETVTSYVFSERQMDDGRVLLQQLTKGLFDTLSVFIHFDFYRQEEIIVR
jgi:hypothetical protein